MSGLEGFTEYVYETPCRYSSVCVNAASEVLHTPYGRVEICDSCLCLYRQLKLSAALRPTLNRE